MRANVIATAFGPKGCGKTHLMRQWAARFSRVLTFDVTGERVEEFPNAPACYDARATLAALNSVAGMERWHIIAMIDPPDAVTVLRALAPPGMRPNAGFSVAVGGVCIELPELDYHAPLSGIDPIVRGAYLRGRHYRLSILGDTQRPANTARLVSAQSDALFIFAQDEPADVAYFEKVVGADAAALLSRLPPYWYLRKLRGRPGIDVIRADGSTHSTVERAQDAGELAPLV